ncbi:hypothetical protein K2Z83_19700 [Oscillochloris sp. ZM17-4]|uniref:hypothetical protein n=1 Tax=Oscillochloris sp. ZM17-4 TaxID=2866714 RepID=UPI001C734D77|nr:hypothetical protein [Oscillochloris sp. ZM17-4]MBX0329893.1 hypothetical protein [Oscillochloris sp. ZM17-4]
MARTLFIGALLAVLLLPMRLFGQEQRPVTIVAVSTDAFPIITTTVHTALASAGDAPAFTLTLADKELPLTASAPVQVPMMVSVVADLSDGMRPAMSPGLTRLDVMQQRLSELVWRLQAEPNVMSLVLVGDTVELAHQQTSDLGGVDNTVANGNPAFPFTLVVRDQLVEPSGGLLQEGLARGLAQFDSAEPTQPRALVLFASGDSWQSTDLLTIQPALEAARRERPVELLIVGFGGDSTTTPLRAAAAQMGATYIHQDDSASAEQKEALNAAYATLTALGHYTQLSAVADGVPAGMATLQVVYGDASAEQEIDVPALAPQVVPLFVTDHFQDSVRIGVAPVFAQGALNTVTYLLDGRSLSVIGQPQDDLSIVINTADETFQQQYPPGQQHELVVAVTDAQGLESRSKPVLITVLSPSHSPPPRGLIVGGVVAAIFAGMLFWWYKTTQIPSGNRQSRGEDHADTENPGGGQRPEPDVTRPQGDRGDGPTVPQGDRGDGPTVPQGNRGDKEQTTDPSNSNNTTYGAWELEFLEGVEHGSELLTPTRGTRYEIGRVFIGQQMAPTHIAVANNQVSRGGHAILTLKANGNKLLLKVNTAKNPVYLGENQERELAVNDEEPLSHGDIFWLSNAVKIRVVCKR